ncbi:MAG: hypothetical protein KKB21_00130 [Nanoarchaeota archaeon]|nr:hypothetical protein [Nanoarchaeota archaeon]MBU4085966.1 hypothetical protein [Nanoarchaeota archaeon]
MRRFETLKRAEKERILEKLKEQFGITNLPYLLVKQGREKIRAFSGSLSREELEKLGENVNVDTVGIYLLKEENELRLSHDGASLLQNQITKNILELSSEQADEWLRGHDLFINSEIRGLIVLKYKDLVIGCGKSSGERITNFVPKERRIRS